MELLNAFDIRIYLAVAASLVVFYSVGSVLVGRLSNPIASVGVKLALGGLAAVSLLAVLHAHQNTGLLFYLLLFIWMGWSNRLKPDFTDLKEAGLLSIVVLVGLAFAMLSIEAYRSNLMVDGQIYVGNSDVSFYSSYGHSMYHMGFETNPENRTPEMRGAVYHFGDLWFSGMYSNLFKVLPYYAYNVLFRSFGMFAVLVTMFGWCQQLTRKTAIAALVAVLTLGAVYMELFPLPLPNISLLELFSSVYPMYGLGSHLIVGLAAIPFAKYLEEKNWMIGTAGLLLIPFLNVGMLLVPILAILMIGGVYLLVRIRGKKWLEMEWKELVILLIVSVIPMAYYVLQGRLDSGEGNVLSLSFIYLVIHTAIRAIISQGMVIPYLFGLLFFWKNPLLGTKKLALIQTAFFGATIVAFAAIFPQIQGNSIQILSMHFQGFLAPIGMLGLAAMIFYSEGKAFKWMAIVFFVVVTAQIARVCISSSAYRAAFDWESYIPGYQKDYSVEVDEWQSLHAKLGSETTTFGYFICDSTASGGTHYNEFTYLKSILPGAVFQRINPLPKDTTLSREMQGYYYRTSLGYFTKKHMDNFGLAETEHMNFLKPNYLILPKARPIYCIPDRYLEQVALVGETEKFEIYE